MKRVVCTLLSLILIISVTVSVSAEDASVPSILEGIPENNFEGLSDEEVEDIFRQAFLAGGLTEASHENDINVLSDINPEVVELAYMDMETADAETQEKILAARNEIIYQSSWSNGGWSDGGILIIVNEDGEFEFPPKFSDLFPGWDFPEEPQENSSTVPAEPIPQTNEPVTQNDIMDYLGVPNDTTQVFYDYSYTLKNPSSSTISRDFVTIPTTSFQGKYNVISGWAESLPAGTSSYNLGYTVNGVSQDYAANLRAGKYTTFFLTKPAMASAVGIRASTSSNPGSAHMIATRSSCFTL